MKPGAVVIDCGITAVPGEKYISFSYERIINDFCGFASRFPAAVFFSND